MLPQIQETLQGAYARLESVREPFLNRARACATLTIPSLIPPKGHTGHSELPTPYQSLGSRGVNNLSAKLTLTLMPPNQPNFKLTMDAATREKLGAKLGEVQKTLSSMERTVVEDLEATSVRPSVAIAMKHLVVAGNVLTFESPDRGIRVFPMSHYVVQRDPQGRVIRIVLREQVAPETLPEEVLSVLEGARAESKSPEKTLELFTGITRVGKKFEIRQEILGIAVPGSDGSYPVEKCPWNAARLIVVENEDYGRSYVEEFIGDLKSLEVLTRSMVHSAAAAAKIVFLVSPNGQTSQEDIEEAEGGDVRTGMAEDVSVLKLDKASDLSWVETRIQKITEALSYSFLLNASIQRQAERVTAEEIRFMANELETQLGGIYSMLAQEYQLPLITVRIASLEKAGKLPVLPKGTVRPAITTGVDAIGRGNDFEKLRAFVGFLANTLGPEKVAQVIDSQELADRAAAAMGVESDGLVKTKDQIAEEQQQAQQAQMQQAAVAPSINQAGQMAQQQVQQ